MAHIESTSGSGRWSCLRTGILVTALLLVSSSVQSALAGTVTLTTRSAGVWARDQVIRGVVIPPLPGNGTVYVNGAPASFTIPAPGDSFSVGIVLANGATSVSVAVDSSGVTWTSDTIALTLGYRLRPECYAYGTVVGRTVTLHVSVVGNPENSALTSAWSADVNNPAGVIIAGSTDSTASFTFDAGAPLGEYYFNARVSAAGGDTSIARTFVTLDADTVRAFEIASDHARWIDTAIVYGVTPYIFVGSGRFADVTAKIPELTRLGVTALWIQPVYATHDGGQGYDVMDYFTIRPDLGGESALRTLVATAHANGLKVLFDFVPNHTSIYHPYAQDAIRYGSASHYYDFYQRAPDGAPYGNNYNTRTNGLMTFVYYFWTDLVNLNYGNPEVQRMMIEAGKYWIERLSIDGYRVDAAWGPNARNREFFRQWRLALKRIKPEILLLAEDKASVLSGDPFGRPSPFDQEFDAAYDWTQEPSWVSHWVWQSYYSSNSNPTIFNNTAEAQRGQALRNSLTNSGAGYHPGAIVFRFLENNDTFRFLATHDLPRTKMAAALLFSLKGIPLVYNGQEIGAATHPYSTYAIFSNAGTIQSQDTHGLFPYYQQLAGLRRRFSALINGNFQEVGITPSASQFAFRRWSGSQNIFVCVNMAAAPSSSTLSIPTAQLLLDSTQTYYLTDLISGQYYSGTPASLASATISMPGYATRMFALADSIFSVTSVADGAREVVPLTVTLEQNYPNPFNPSTTISYQLPVVSNVRLAVYDILGREVVVLVNQQEGPGSHSVTFDARGGPGLGGRLASGVYFYRLESAPVSGGKAGGLSFVKKMLLLK